MSGGAINKEEIAEFILSHLKEDDFVLDVGCGNGGPTQGAGEAEGRSGFQSSSTRKGRRSPRPPVLVWRKNRRAMGGSWVRVNCDSGSEDSDLRYTQLSLHTN
ncbi:hypothetical protein AKJ58_01690 [candidate division MSBL1 archaeon SCGC-AAA385D11]|uniref:Methyltransferase domain-containing protein n=1 Tax=candidate division MSBL1 archaeon SCGC-AAA385D11 TaxID=1698286 RepID=A0A133VMY4_9EURY|nr:hypothetical protein AKJ58_01690 [candidate division MSBL1 archaeon SCGC-AAA385D11]